MAQGVTYEIKKKKKSEWVIVVNGKRLKEERIQTEPSSGNGSNGSTNSEDHAMSLKRILKHSKMWDEMRKSDGDRERKRKPLWKKKCLESQRVNWDTFS